MREVIRPGLVLCIITIIAGICLGGVYTVTKEPIEAQKELKKVNGCREIFAEADTFEENITVSGGVNLAYSAYKGSELVGYIFGVAPKGYGGAIPMLVSIDLDGVIKGVKILDISTETPGLGANAVNPSFLSQYSGKTVSMSPIAVTKQPSNDAIEAMTSATITTKAVTSGVNTALEFFKGVK